jgi:hypothetical protein
MMTRVAILAVLLVASCASPPPKAPAPPPPPETPTVAPVQTPATPLQPPPERVRDACGAYELQSLIGKPRSEIPVPVDPSRRRVACTTCPVTQDFREDRLNIFFDADSGLVKSVTCG